MAIRTQRPDVAVRFKKSAEIAAPPQAQKKELPPSPSSPPTSAPPISAPPISTGTESTQTTPAKTQAPAKTTAPTTTAPKKDEPAAEFSTQKGKTTAASVPVPNAVSKPAQLLVHNFETPNPGVDLTSQEAVQALVTSPPLPAQGLAPSAQALTKLVTTQLGAVSKMMSAAEIGRVLGHPEWTSALEKLPSSLVKKGQGSEPNWLLAAQLARWMRGIDAPGMSLSDVAKSFKAANAMAQKAAPHLDGAMVASLQKAYPFMPQWQTAPKRTTVDDDWSNLATTMAKSGNDDVWTQKLDSILQSISEVPLTLPLSNTLGDRLATTKPFAKHNVVMVQHMLGQAIPLCAELARAGMDMTKAEYVGVPYQKNPAVKLSLERTMGLKVTVGERGDIDGMWKHVTEAVDRAYERHLKNDEPILILDDGGYASKYIAQKYADKASIFCLVEQTTRGLTEISQIKDPPFAIANVAGSYGKRFESAQVGDAVVQCVRKVLDEVATTPTRKEVLVVGGGKVGLGVADSFKGDGARVTFFDPYVTPSRKKELEALGYTVITDKASALNKKFLVVGCSGHRSIDMSDFVKMSSPVFLASASSKRVEIDTLGLAELTKGDDGVMRRILAAKVNEQETWHYWMNDGRIVTAIADGLPANFQDVNSIAPELIDHTMALMLLGAEKATQARGKARGLVDLDAGQQFELQAQMEGLSQAQTSPSDIALQVGALTFYGSKAAWMAIAKSPATPPSVTDALVDKFSDKDPMNPILLEALLQPKEISDASLQKLLDLGALPQIARLMKNEGLRGDQEEKLVAWCEEAYAAVNQHRTGTTAINVNAVEKAPSGEWRWCGFSRAAGEPRGRPSQNISTVYDLLNQQLTTILFAHPRCPHGFIDYAMHGMSGGMLRFDKQDNIHMLQNPSLKTEELHKLLKDGVSSLWDRGNEKPAKAAYAVDVFEALRDHPSADEALQRECERGLAYIKKTQMERYNSEPRGKADWIDSPLGMKVPAYA